MKKIADIRGRREKRFWDNRMKLAKVKKQYDKAYELKKHANLISDNMIKEQVENNIDELLIKK